jgi:hypothetical protein
MRQLAPGSESRVKDLLLNFFLPPEIPSVIESVAKVWNQPVGRMMK